MTNKVVIWGYPPNTHTHSYVHLGFAKAFSYLDYDVTWYDDDEDYSEEDVSDAIIISESNCCKYLPIVNSSKYFIHNISDDFTLKKSIEGDNIHNLLVYHEGYSWNDDIQKIDDFSWFDSNSKTMVIMWATDLLPGEVNGNSVVMHDESKKNINYVGSLSNQYLSQMSAIASSNGKNFRNIGGYSGTGFIDNNDAKKLMRDSYLNFDFRPPGHIKNGYIPCRIFKSMSYGCWIGTNSEKILKFFDGRITSCENLEDLYNKTKEDSLNATKEILQDNKNYIEKNHTYVNRINSILKIL